MPPETPSESRTETATPPPYGRISLSEIRDLTSAALSSTPSQVSDVPQLIAVYSPKRPLCLAPGERTQGGSPREFEVLLRLRTPDGGIIGALPVIDAARELGMMPDLDHHMLNVACTEGMQRMQSQRTQSPTRISWNACAETLNDIDFAERVLRTLSDHDFPASRLAIEIPEEAASLQALGRNQVLGQMRELMTRGVQAHADDLPTHASCEIARRLVELRHHARLRIPIGFKIDYGVTKALREGDSDAETAFEEIFAMARQEPDIIVTAEGAEIGTPMEVHTRFLIWALLHRQECAKRASGHKPLVLLQGGLPRRLSTF